MVAISGLTNALQQIKHSFKIYKQLIRYLILIIGVSNSVVPLNIIPFMPVAVLWTEYCFKVKLMYFLTLICNWRDEDEPSKIEDLDAVKPKGWLDDEPQYVPDPNAKKPKDW